MKFQFKFIVDMDNMTVNEVKKALDTIKAEEISYHVKQNPKVKK